MGVDVDEAGGNDLAAGVDLLGPGAAHRAYRRDQPVLDRDIALERLAALPVVDEPAAHDEIIGAFHGRLPGWSWLGALWSRRRGRPILSCIRSWPAVGSEPLTGPFSIQPRQHSRIDLAGVA